MSVSESCVNTGIRYELRPALDQDLTWNIQMGAQNLDFVPLSVESLGGWTPTAIKLITKLATQKASRNNHDIKRTIAQEFKVLNILLMRGNASLLLNRYQAQEIPQEEVLADL